MKVIFFGTPQFAADVLLFLLQNKINIVAVVTKPDRPQGRSSALIPTPVKQVALDHSLPLFQPEKISAAEHATLLQQFQADLFVVVAFGEIIKQHLLDMPKRGCINLHTSLLPKYRGAAPIQRCLIAGEQETGATVMQMVKKMDAGDILKCVRVPIGPNTTYGELEQTLCEVGAKALLSTILDYEKGPVPHFSQDESCVTFAPKIELEECEIKWDQPAQVIHNLVRGVNPHPGAWCYVKIKGEQKRLKINRTQIIESQEGISGEMIGWGANGLIVRCAEKALRLSEIRPEGRKAMSDTEFMRGITKEQFQIIL